MQLIAGYQKPNKGNIEIMGHQLYNNTEAQQHLCYMKENHPFSEIWTARDALRFNQYFKPNWNITYREGMTKTLIGTMIIAIAAMFLYYSGMIDVPLEWLSTLNLTAMTGFTMAGIAGLIALLTTYPIMRNASLQPKEKRE